MSARLRTAAIFGAGALILALGTGISLAQAGEDTLPTDTTVVEPEDTTTTTAPPEQETTTTTTTAPEEPEEVEQVEEPEEVEKPDNEKGEKGEKGEPGNKWFRDCLAEHGVGWPPGVGYHKPERKGPPSEELRQKIRAAKDACTGSHDDDGDDPEGDGDETQAGEHPNAPDRHGPPSANCEDGRGRGHCKGDG